MNTSKRKKPSWWREDILRGYGVEVFTYKELVEGIKKLEKEEKEELDKLAVERLNIEWK